jgi:hypothetical protein
MAAQQSDKEFLSELLREINDGVEHRIKGVICKPWTLWMLGYHGYPDAQRSVYAVLHLRYCFAGDLHERCFVFDGRERSGNLAGHLSTANSSHDDLYLSHDQEDGTDCSVLVGIVQLAEPSQKVVLKGVSVARLVGLYRLQKRPHVIGQVGDPINLFGPSTLSINNRELQTPFTGRWVLSHHTYRACVDEMVKGASKVMDSISDQQAPPNHTWGVVQPDVDAVMSALTLWFGLDRVGVTLRPTSDFAVEGINVFASPINLGFDAVEGVGGV